MSSDANTTVLITGANRGIGRGLAEAYLSRSNHTVIAAVRNIETATLKDLKVAEGSKLLLVKIENTSDRDPAAAVQKIREAGVTALDVVVANAGLACPVSSLARLEDLTTEQLREMFEANTFSFIPLFHAIRPLLKARADAGGESQVEKGPRLLVISSTGGQIVDMEKHASLLLSSYGASKAALNYLVRRAHFENPWLTAWLMDPGFVQTDSGNALAELFGMDAAPQTVEQTAAGLLSKIDTATRSETSGGFYGIDGNPLHF
ncbi:hypothetical protein VPNG_06274 [Cytospora leucostoma]|uniref:Ketoreductase (KR) domain-containing protein n=1 Tax=Cytospora leucostoma TaxID=1230097 RepID=A0A423X2D0_9PEZI|nr:hypothetical protein VPNG_06274 [Cytospora leucostoma]